MEVGFPGSTRRTSPEAEVVTENDQNEDSHSERLAELVALIHGG
jgi:hypothetical protein